MKIAKRKIVFEFSEEEKKALETVKRIIADLSNYCDDMNTSIYFNTGEYEATYRDFKDEIDIINDLLNENYDAD